LKNRPKVSAASRRYAENNREDIIRKRRELTEEQREHIRQVERKRMARLYAARTLLNELLNEKEDLHANGINEHLFGQARSDTSVLEGREPARPS
jgi:hypothetical protein